MRHTVRRPVEEPQSISRGRTDCRQGEIDRYLEGRSSRLVDHLDGLRHAGRFEFLINVKLLIGECFDGKCKRDGFTRALVESIDTGLDPRSLDRSTRRRGLSLVYDQHRDPRDDTPVDPLEDRTGDRYLLSEDIGSPGRSGQRESGKGNSYQWASLVRPQQQRSRDQSGRTLPHRRPTNESKSACVTIGQRRFLQSCCCCGRSDTPY